MGKKLRIARGVDPLLEQAVAVRTGGARKMSAQELTSQGVNVRMCTPTQMVSSFDDRHLTHESITRALRHETHEGDVVVCTPQRSGEGILLCMLYMLSIGAKGVRDDGSLKNEQRAVRQRVPRLEDKAFDAEPQRLDDLQDGVLRLYQSALSCKSASTKFGQKGKFIAVLRDPKDMRIAYLKHLERMYERERAGSSQVPPFVARFGPDDFVGVELPFCHGLEGSVSLETNMLDWVEAAEKHDNVHVVFYEDMINAPHTVLERLADFVQVKVSAPTLERVYQHTTYERMMSYYDAFHDFSAHDASVGVGQGVKSFSRAGNVKLNQAWNLHVRSREPKLFNYSTLYERATQSKYPFEYRLYDRAEDTFITGSGSSRGCCWPFGGMRRGGARRGSDKHNSSWL